MNRKVTLRTAAAIIVVTATGYLTLTLTDRPEEARKPDPNVTSVSADASPPGTAAMRAYINPETGKLEVGVPPAAMAGEQALDAHTQNALRRDTAGLVETRHPNGAVSIDLQGRFRSVSVLRKGENGDVVVCTDGSEGTRHTLEGQTAPEVK